MDARDQFRTPLVLGQRWLLAVLWSCLVWALPVHASGGGEIHELLLEATTTGINSPEARDALIEELVAVGVTGVPALLDAIAFGLGSAAEDRIPLVAPILSVVEQALAELPLDALRAHLAGELLQSPIESARIAGMRVLGSTGDASDLGLLAGLAEGTQGSPMLSRSLRDEFRVALQSMALRDSGVVAAIKGSLVKGHPSLLDALVATLGAPKARSSRNNLRDALGVRGEADAMIFAWLVRRIEALGRPNDPKLEALTLKGLSDSRSQTRTQAAVLASALDLVDAVPRLLDMAADSNPLERRAALDALRNLTHVNPLADSEQWLDWSDRDERWWQRQGRNLEEALNSPNSEEVVAAIRGLAQVRWRRERIVPRIGSLALSGQGALRPIAVSALGLMGGREAQDFLLDVLEEPGISSELFEATLHALKSCTDLDVGENPIVWRQVLAIRRR